MTFAVIPTRTERETLWLMLVINGDGAFKIKLG